MAGIAVPSLLSLGLLCAACGSAPARERVAAAPPTSAASAPAPPPTFLAFAVEPGPTSVPAPIAAPASAPSSAQVSAPSSAPATTLVPATASINDPAFEGGDVPKAKASIDKLKQRIEKCINADGGVSSAGASIKLQFLVRAQGIAEGVDVLDAKNVGEKAGKCIRDAFKKKKVGPPSADPVGVTLTIDFSPKEPS